MKISVCPFFFFSTSSFHSRHFEPKHTWFINPHLAPLSPVKKAARKKREGALWATGSWRPLSKMTEEEDKRERLMQKKLQRQPVDQKGLGALEKGQWMPQPSTGSPYRDQEAGTHTKAPWAPRSQRHLKTVHDEWLLQRSRAWQEDLDQTASPVAMTTWCCNAPLGPGTIPEVGVLGREENDPRESSPVENACTDQT